MIEANGASMGYRLRGGPAIVLEQVSFACAAGELTGIAGMNGAGKSTLLRTLGGLLTPLSGEISVDGTRLIDLSLNERARRISLVLTGRIGGFNVTARDAVAAGRFPYSDAFHRLDDSHLRVMENAMGLCGISGYADKPLTELSDGLYQKTMIARALAQETPVMMLDEPNAFLDYASRHQLFGLLRSLCHTQGKCILLSTHDLDLILRYCDKVMMVAGGRVTLLPVKEAATHPAFIETGGGFL